MSTVEDFIKKIVESGQTNDRPVYVINLEDLAEKVSRWRQSFPRVEPFYAMKCNDAPPFLEAISSMGIGYDCASMVSTVLFIVEKFDTISSIFFLQIELQQAFTAGAKSEQIIFANPCKTPSMLKFAKEVGVDLMTADCVEEVEKIHRFFPAARIVLRIKVDDTSAKYKLGYKFGATSTEVNGFLECASKLGMTVVGIAFHVGSDCTDPDAYSTALEMAAEVSSRFPKYGFSFDLLDIGGGFPGDIDFNNENDIFYKMVKIVNSSLEKYFPEKDYSDLKIISEPGRYFCSSGFILVTKIVGKRIIKRDTGDQAMYYLNDGLYGGFLIKFWEPQMIVLNPIVDEEKLKSRKVMKTTVWGPTCDAGDIVVQDVDIPEMEVGEFFATYNYGAYTVPLITPFNQMERPEFRVFHGKFNQKYTENGF